MGTRPEAKWVGETIVLHRSDGTVVHLDRDEVDAVRRAVTAVTATNERVDAYLNWRATLPGFIVG